MTILYASIITVLGKEVAFTKIDALQAAELWAAAFTFTNSHPRLLCTSAFLLNYSSRYSISYTRIAAVLQTFIKLQEAQGQANSADSLTAYLFPSGLPRKLTQYIPDYFAVVDSGATVHVLHDSVCAAYTKEANSAIK